MGASSSQPVRIPMPPVPSQNPAPLSKVIEKMFKIVLMEKTYLNGGCSIAMFDCQRVDKGSYINGKTICEHGIFQPFLSRKE